MKNTLNSQKKVVEILLENQPIKVIMAKVQLNLIQTLIKIKGRAPQLGLNKSM